MSASVSRSLTQPQGLGRLWWLPPNGDGNGLDDAAWAPIADVSATIVAPLLAAFRAARVPAYAAPADQLLTRRGASERRPRAGHERQIYHIWVGTSGHARAEEVLRIALPRLQRQADA
ncbi:MAG TPA: hypothetical protein VMA73_09575 [Streptosporangiaceae bacterium]|nr:hypothetical protein [Streptosporangiaceae bacterium]